MAQVKEQSTSTWSYVLSVQNGNPKVVSIIGAPGSSTVTITRRVGDVNSPQPATPSNNVLNATVSSKQITAPGVYDIQKSGSDNIGLDVN